MVLVGGRTNTVLDVTSFSSNRVVLFVLRSTTERKITAIGELLEMLICISKVVVVQVEPGIHPMSSPLSVLLSVIVPERDAKI